MDKPPASSSRLLSLDAFRGATIAGMILVNNPGSWDYVYPQLRHKEWHGWTFTDWIFPFFLFIVGVAMVFSFSRRMEQQVPRGKVMLHVLRRSAIIFALGLFLNALPAFDLATLRIPGVLQRIAVCYLIASLIVLNGGIKAQAAWLVSFLASYWLLMMLVPVPGIGAGSLERETNLAAYIDRMVLDGHMWAYTKTWDPEGILSTLPATATTLFGVMTGHWLRAERPREEKAVWMFVTGYALLLLGAILDMWLPINKNLWTSSYSIFMAGWALVCLAIFYWLIDVKGYKAWATPFVIFGMNAIAVYVFAGIVETLLTMGWNSAGEPYWSPMMAVYDRFFSTFLGPLNASLAYAICMVLLMFLVAWVLWKRKLFFKV